jgi:ATP synthase protein I
LLSGKAKSLWEYGKLSRIAAPQVYKITIVQLLILLAASLLLSALDLVVAYSLVLGGLVAVMPQAYFAVRVFRHRGAKSANAIAKSSYRGEIGKYVLSTAGFALIFALIEPVNALAVFVGFFAMLVIQIIGAWLLLTPRLK